MKNHNYCIKCGKPLVATTIDGHKRKACSSENCDYVFWNNPIPVITIVVEYDGNVILARNSAWKHKIYSVITGFLEQGETPEECAVREVQEELGIESRVENFLGLLAFPQTNQLLIGYHVIGHGEIQPGDEIMDYRLIPINKLRGWDFGTGFAVNEFLKIKGLL